jgi:hypothetical protein
MRRSLKLIIASAAAGGLAAGISLASLPAATLSAARAPRAAGHTPSRTQLDGFLHGVTAPNKPAHLPGGFQPQVASGITAVGSYNWSGYAALSTTKQYFTKVSGSWTVPAVTCTAEDRLTVNWVGLDGAADSTVEQLGTLSWCYEGAAHYYSWYEMYPTATVTVGTTVKAGDKVSASVTRTGTSYALTLTDSTTAGNNISATATCSLASCLDESAEWITERPAFEIGIVPLAKFSTAKFTAGTATGGGKSGTIKSFGSLDDISMVDATTAYVLDTTGPLNAKGNSFTNTWKNSY